eukprot:Filipodium_phascolosomae@DN7014_c0_g1_i1.p1
MAELQLRANGLRPFFKGSLDASKPITLDVIRSQEKLNTSTSSHTHYQTDLAALRDRRHLQPSLLLQLQETELIPREGVHIGFTLRKTTYETSDGNQMEVAAETLSRWLQEERVLPAMNSVKNVKAWTKLVKEGNGSYPSVSAIEDVHSEFQAKAQKFLQSLKKK